MKPFTLRTRLTLAYAAVLSSLESGGYVQHDPATRGIEILRPIDDWLAGA